MQVPAIQLQTTPDRFILTFNRAKIGQSDFLEMLQWLTRRLGQAVPQEFSNFEAVLSGEAVLPGFELRLKDLTA